MALDSSIGSALARAYAEETDKMLARRGPVGSRRDEEVPLGNPSGERLVEHFRDGAVLVPSGTIMRTRLSARFLAASASRTTRVTSPSDSRRSAVPAPWTSRPPEGAVAAVHRHYDACDEARRRRA